MPRLLVFSNPSESGREAEYNQWYSSVHIPEVLAVPGFVGATRHRVSDTQVVPLAGDFAGYRYVAVYEIEGDLAGALERLTAAGTDGTFNMSDAMSMDPMPITVACDDIE